jgi:O-antigen/teichoic acid export membrane protein
LDLNEAQYRREPPTRGLAAVLGAQWFATLYVAVVSAALVIILGRVLGPEGFGIYSYALAIAAIWANVQEGGFRPLVFRETTEPTPALARLAGRLCNLAVGHVLMTTGVGLALLALLPLEHKFVLLAALLCLGFSAIGHYVSARLKGENRFIKEAQWAALGRTATVIGIAIALFVGGVTPAMVFVGWGLAQAVVLLLPVARPCRVRPEWHFDPDLYRALGAFLTVQAATAVYFQIDIALITHLTGDAVQTGHYAAAYRVLEGLTVLSTPLAHIAFRYLRLRWARNKGFMSLLGAFLLGAFAVAALAVAGGLWLGPELIRVAFGEKFAISADYLPWLLTALVFLLPNYILSQAAIAMNAEGGYALSAAVGAALNILLNLWLIPIYGPIGAAWATIATEGMLTIALCVLVLKRNRSNGGGV